MSDDLPLEFQAVVNDLVDRHAPGSQIAVRKTLTGGNTGASVLLVDINPTTGSVAAAAIAKRTFGEFVLKLDVQRTWDKPEPSESDRHEAAQNWNREFAAEHIPELLAHAERNRSQALLYEIAGKSLINLVSADTLDAGALKSRGSEIAHSLLSYWNRNHKHSEMSPRSLLEDWLGYRLNATLAPSLHNYIIEITGNRKVMIEGEQLLVNPLWFCDAQFIRDEPASVCFIGHLHGDLHPGNIMIERHDPRRGQFWLIDFALSQNGPLGYDNAYLELAILLRHLEGAGPERIIGVLEALEWREDMPQASMVPVQDLGLLESIRAIRAASEQWQREAEPNRRDRHQAQALLASIAVALNWCNKPIGMTVRRLALTYGAWNARKYIRIFHDGAWRQLISESGEEFASRASPARVEVDISDEPRREEWNALWEHVSRFDEGRAKFILVTDRIAANSDLAGLGMLPWSVIIDLDPKSDESGLFSAVGSVLAKLRSLQEYGQQSITVDFQRGTAWLMADGWPSRHELIPSSLRQWRQIYLPCIQELASTLRKDIAPQPVKVLVLNNDNGSGEKLARVLEALDERLGDSAEFTVLGASVPADSSVVTTRFSVAPLHFVAGVRRMYGAADDAPSPQIPGGDGLVTIPIDQLRNIEEDLEVLHSRVLSSDRSRDAADSTFWRGTPPAWADLHANLDVIRDVHSALIEALEHELLQSRNYTIELHHTPGAGGTTVALRAAWTLRTKYATAILRRHSRLTLDRIDQLFQLSQRPILLIAEASELPSSAREELYRGLASRNSRVVILYVVRTIQLNNDRAPNVGDPMDREEARRFFKRYSALTGSSRRQSQLGQITESIDLRFERYRSPFFYGLITFEREFQSIDRYVDVHLRGVTHRVRQVMLYLALVTRYSQSALDESLIMSLLELRPSGSLELSAAFGEGPAQLIVRHGRQLKILHPLIAEEVLRSLLGGQSDEAWLYGLKDIAIDFIRDTARILGSDSVEANRLFFQLFILRDVWYERQARGRPRFSEFVNAIPTVSGQSQVLELLTEICPKEAHYWNHLGRHHFYEVKQDFDQAERYLEKAVALSPDDSYHHHSLGMVRRFWIEHKLTQLFDETDAPPSAGRLLEEVSDLYDRAAENFSRSRSLNVDDEHGYITHLQMLLHLAERLLRASGNDLHAATDEPGPVGDWLKSNIVLAEELLSSVRHHRGPGAPSNYEVRCESQLSGIYGDFEEIIAGWETLLAGNAGQGYSAGQIDLRRALAFAYWARGNRAWSGLPETELRHIAAMMETNLRRDPTNERDIRTWFQAYRRLPEYSHLEALDRLGAWASRADSLDANYYLYILHFLRLRDGSSRSEDFVRASLDKCRELARGRRVHSYEWLGKEPQWCPLVHQGDLGDWPKGAGFYSNTQLLAEVTGTIDAIKGPQAGTIRLGQFLRAFFVPSTNQWMSKDVNTVVHFYLGFSYDGFRAWSVRAGPATSESPTAHRTSRELARQSDNFGTSENAPLPVSEVQNERPTERTDEFRHKMLSVVWALVTDTENRGEELFITNLGNRLAKEFGQAPFQTLGYSNLSGFLRSLPGLVIEGDVPRLVLRRAPGGNAPNTMGIDLLESVTTFVFEKIDLSIRQGRVEFVSRLGNDLRAAFPGKPVYERLGFLRLTDFLRSIDGISVEGEVTREVVRRSK